MRAAALLLLALLALPTASAAAEGFSHQILLVGRLIDAQGEPAAGLAVEVELHHAATGGRCFGVWSETTNATGDFRICRHAHVLTDDVTATVSAGGARAEVPVDARLRQGVAMLVLDGSREARDVAGDRAFHATLRATGRAVFAHPAGATFDEVRVNATPLAGMPVRVFASAEGAILAEANATTDANGDWLADLPLDAWPASAVVRAEAAGRAIEAPANVTLRRVQLDMIQGEVPGSATRPGAGAPEIPEWPALAVALVVALSARARWRAR